MNIYCATCKKEFEIERNLGTEIYVFPGCDCTTKEEPQVVYSLPDSVKEALNNGDGVYRP